MGTGYLTTDTRINLESLPIEGARVQISNTNGEVLYDLTTNESGQTDSIALETVDRELTFDPEYTGHPYTSYNVLVEADGFETIQINGVHIFDGESAHQPVVMIPLTNDETVPEELEINIGEQAVEMDGSRNQEGPIIEPRVLRHVIIPNRITVHLGTPSSNAQNVSVPFPDYVKNVASSEIFPTWPEQSLRANIYAIITFALNRVFTEWYRSRGYSFDITNSTAYDQYFVYGRTIYDSISRIVDEIFNQFVRRAGQYAPFFTSFCNGTTATCSGLSQWGTVSLANSGYNALSILRHYYPSDVEIAETNIFTDLIESYPGTPLRFGDTGLDVQIIQTQLTRIRRNYPAIPVITDEAGVFGTTTQAAVRTFQSIFSLTADGIVGRAAWFKISYIFVAITNLAGLASEGLLLDIGTVPPSSVLRQGSSGFDVITLQYILDFIGEVYPPIPEVTQNGFFGVSTHQAVVAFQQMMGLTQDGVVGPATWDALYDVYWGIRNNVIVPEVTETVQYIVQSGDTLWLIAQRFGTTVDTIKRLNNLTSDSLYIGQVLRIPVTSAEVEYFTYTVQSGDTLWLLAQRFGTTVDEIKRINNLTSDTLDVGQQLRIPGTAPTPTPTPPPPPETGATFTHVVQSGDTLYLLARRFGTTVAEIKRLNNLTSDSLYIGQQLQIPGNLITHTVQSGDTLWLLAQRYGTNVDAIKELNGLTSSSLFIGQILHIPR